MDHDVFVLLDDCSATAQQPVSRLYTGFVREHRCTDPLTLDALWQQVEHDQHSGLHAALLADYEWGCQLQQAGLGGEHSAPAGALRVLMFAQLRHLSAEAVADWLAECDGSASPTAAGISALVCDTTPAQYAADIARIRDCIRRGETYQVNYTVRLHGQQYGSPVGLYRRLRAMQPVAYGALAHLPGMPDSSDDREWVLSASPELFVRCTLGHLTARPMKGTAPRHADRAQDQEQAQWLQHDPKNRAENVMIVDLLRNDLGRISRTGSVRVPHLFTVEPYATVHQMTSTVESELRHGVRFPEVLRALYPCGSITGAPKLHTMDLIATLESSPRGLYCGMLGWVDAPRAPDQPADFCLSVAIRTLVLGRAPSGWRPMTMGVGSGVVLDSVAGDEYAETQTKARFLTRMDPGFTLFETMRVRSGRIAHLQGHMARLRSSAHELGFAGDEAQWRHALAQYVQRHCSSGTFRLRLDLHHDGTVALQHAALLPLNAGPAPLVLAAAPLSPQESMLLQHKTSLRQGYDTAIRQATALGAFDAVFLNARGEVCEGARSSLLVQSAGHWFTPALHSGVLNGVMRRRLLRRYPGITEKVLQLDDLLSADSLAVCSALRGLQRAQWLHDAQGAIVRLEG